MSSPLSSYYTGEESPLPPSSKSAPESKALPISYRPARLLPYELRHHCIIFFEEQLCKFPAGSTLQFHSNSNQADNNALVLLNNILVSGTSFPSPPEPTWVPPPSHIALASTLLIHPLHTTRASSRDRLSASSHAYTYLRNLLAIVGPKNAELTKAFSFHNNGARKLRKIKDDDSSEEDDEIKSSFAGDASVWFRGKDFWHIVGWAFNCSVKHRKRWEYWMVWLRYMLDVIDADWKEREGQADKNHPLEESLIANYLANSGGRSTIFRRIVKSIFADGSVESMKAYPEVFENEPKERKSPQAGIKRKAESHVDIDKDEYGDYITQDNDFDDSPESEDDKEEGIAATKKKRKRYGPDYAVQMGGPEAMALRLRLLGIVSHLPSMLIYPKLINQLSRTCDAIPSVTTSIGELYELFRETIRPLPIPVFQLFINPSVTIYLIPIAFNSIVQCLIRPLLSHDAPDPNNDDHTIEQPILEKCFLPFPANTSSLEDNAKVSILNEALLRLLNFVGGIEWTPSLEKSVEKGIAAREKKVTERKKGKKKTQDDGERKAMEESAMRMRLLLAVLKRKESAET
jgi:hypothetical protein